MAEPLRLMYVLAHPDDESLGMGGSVAKYAAEGIAVSLVMATRGERGWQGDPGAYPGPAALGRLREAELRAAADLLGIGHLAFLGYLDGDLDRADPAEAVRAIVGHLRRERPHVVATFAPDGGYGHPDHIAISQFTAAAVVAAADAGYTDPSGAAPHRVAKFYYRVWTPEEGAAYRAVFGDIVIPVDGVERRFVGWPEWLLTTRIDTAAHWQTAWRAVACHRSQLPGYQALERLPEEHHRVLWGSQGYYRVFSLVNGGRRRETDLFAGLR